MAQSQALACARGFKCSVYAHIMPIPHLATGGAVRVDEVCVGRDCQLLAVEGRCLWLERVPRKIVFISCCRANMAYSKLIREVEKDCRV